MRVDRRRRKPVTDDDRNRSCIAATARQSRLRIRIKLAPEIRTREVVVTAWREAGNLLCFQTESGKALQQRFRVESRVNRIAGARMVKGKFEQCLGGEACARATQCDACRRELTQALERRGRFGPGQITRQ